jgi:LmbE family N-acetylglucosaminyl deacetylase
MRVLAIGAHPDDIEPQIGGTLCRMANEGADIINISATTTLTGATYEVRHSEGKEAAKIIGCKYLNLEMDQESLDFSRENIKVFDQVILSHDPDLIFTMSSTDSHNDHQSVNKCVISAARKNKCSIIELNQALPGGINTPKLNYFSDISKCADKKYQAIECYESQITKFGPNWLEMIKARDIFWGLNMGLGKVEAANIIKWIYK